MRSLLLSSAFTLLALSHSLAQVNDANGPCIGNPGGTVPGAQDQNTGLPSTHQQNQADRIFLIAAGYGGAAEVGIARLAEQKGQSDR